jgi:hypothetical protein
MGHRLRRRAATASRHGDQDNSTHRGKETPDRALVSDSSHRSPSLSAAPSPPLNITWENRNHATGVARLRASAPSRQTPCLDEIRYSAASLR